MAVRSLAQQSLISPTSNNSMLAGYQTNMFHHLETIRLGSSAASVEFTNLGQYSDYQHLHLRTVLRSNRNDTNSRSVIRFNSDSGTNYVNHYLGGQGSSVFTGDDAFGHSNGIVNIDSVAGATQTAGSFGGAVVDILDPFNVSKYTTVRFLDGQTGTFRRVSLNSGLWKNTASISVITVADLYGNFVSGSRFSLYGIKARA